MTDKNKISNKTLYSNTIYSSIEDVEMIALSWLEELIKYSVQSAFIKNERAVNLLVIAPPETAKTELLQKFKEITSCVYITSFTRYGMLRDYQTKLQTRETRTLLVPDLIQLITSTNPNELGAAMTFLSSLIEEGVQNLSTFNLQIKLDKPLRANMIACIPKDVILDGRSMKKWLKTGLFSRMIPVSYCYDKAVIAEILEYINNREHVNEKNSSIKIPKEDIEVALNPILARKFNPIVLSISQKVGTYGFRLLRQLQTLAMAKAVYEGRDKVIEDDIRRIIELAAWINLDFNPIKQTQTKDELK